MIRAGIGRGKIGAQVSLALKYAVLILGAALMIIPFFWMISTSFKTFQETFVIPISWLPREPTLENYRTVLQKMKFAQYYFNTIIVALSVTTGQLLIASIAAYAFARMRFPGKNIIFFCLLSVFMVPGQMTLIPKYLMINHLKWQDTFAALIVPGLFSVYAAFFLRQFFMSLPGELEDSARIDGCSHFRTFLSVMLPLCVNAIVALSIFSILGAWNDLLWPIIVTTTEKRRVLAVALATLQGQYSTKNNLLMAASVIATMPMLVVFALGQRQIIDGITVTGLKA